jgi:GMP synthase (glutamine-hydrolysing)
MEAKGRPGAGVGYAEALKALRADVTTTVIAPYEGDEMPDLGPFDGVVFTGSAVEWNTDDPRAEPLAKIMRRVFGKGLPTLGSCNGMQLAASVLGGSSQASPNGHENGFAKEVHLTEAGRAHPMMAGRTDGYQVPCVHRDEVVTLPDGAVLLAGNAHSAVQAMVYEKDGIKFWGMQYHPELEPGPLGQHLSAHDRVSAEIAAELAVPETPEAEKTRTLELQNWLASL